MKDPVSDWKAKFPIGWGGGSKYRSDYKVGTDRKISHTGHASGYVRARKEGQRIGHRLGQSRPRYVYGDAASRPG
jgi:hypothetical protein